MNRIEVNVQTGTRTVIPLTDAEITDAQARTAKEALRVLPKSELELLKERVAALEATR